MNTTLEDENQDTVYVSIDEDGDIWLLQNGSGKSRDFVLLTPKQARDLCEFLMSAT